MTMLMEPKDAAQLVCLRVVEGWELRSLTERGWRIVESIITSEPIDLFVAMSDEEARARGQMLGGCGQTYYDGVGQVPFGMKRSKVLGQICKYLIGQPAESALEDLQVELDAMKEAVRLAETEAREASKATKTASEALARKTELHDALLKERDDLYARFYKLDAQRRTFELDIGKLRTALGDLRMKEILGSSGT